MHGMLEDMPPLFCTSTSSVHGINVQGCFFELIASASSQFPGHHLHTLSASISVQQEVEYLCAVLSYACKWWLRNWFIEYAYARHSDLVTKHSLHGREGEHFISDTIHV